MEISPELALLHMAHGLAGMFSATLLDVKTLRLWLIHGIISLFPRQLPFLPSLVVTPFGTTRVTLVSG